MSKYEHIYEPAEDSQILLDNSLKQIKQIIKLQKNSKITINNNKQPKITQIQNLKICEIGVGSGFVISNIAKIHPNNSYYGTDINPHAIKITKQKFKEQKQKITLKQTNLLENIKQQFDLIIFNTPYLPLEKGEKYEDLKIKDKAIYGGKKGYEVIEKFIYQINDKLKENGQVLIIFSSFSNLECIEKILDRNQFNHKILEKKTIFFEDIYCMKINKYKILKQISKTTAGVKYLTDGKHSIVFDAIYNKQNVIIKIGEFKDIQIETVFLEKLQKENFTPKLFQAKDNFVIMEKLEGQTIKQFIENKTITKEQLIKVLNKILKITQKLDKLKINKFELTNPYKHIYIDKNLTVKFIDFERALYTDKPKNTTQILQYIRRNTPLLKEKKIQIDKNKILKISKKYKKEIFEIKLENIIY